MRYMILALFLLSPIVTLGQHSHSTKSHTQTAVGVTGLGDVDHPVSTNNPEAQQFFNQGLAYVYAFNHEEAVRSFKRAAELDPQLAMAYWGASLALGSNYNLQADAPQLKEAYSLLQKALERSAQASDHERAFINALAKRYSSDSQADRQKLASDYRIAMRELAKQFPDDPDAATLYAESMMNLRPWKLWSLDGKPAEDTEEIVAVLESVLRRYPNHTGANHYYIHAVEASKNPERALPSADRLRTLAPKAGHLVHMPSHIYIRTGDYDDAAKSNADAIVADREYISTAGSQNVYSMMYYNHNIHFLASANTMKGRYADAIKSARELEANVKPHLQAMPMLEMFYPYSTVTLSRFGKWDELLKAPKPTSELKISTAFWHYGRGSAFAATKQTAQAEKELQAMRSVMSTIPAEAGFGNNTALGILKVGEQLLDGRVAFSRGDTKRAFELFRTAVATEDAVSYNEPADWDIPARELLGGVLLLTGDYAEAEKVFRDEIAKHRRNGRALFGLAESLRKQKKLSSAKMVQREFDRAWETADTKITIEDLAGVAAAAATSAQAWTFGNITLKSGVRLHYAEQGDPNGTPVIMLHGYTDSWFSFSRVLPLLNSKLRVFVLDQRGHGDSERPVDNYSIPTFAADVLAFIDAKQLSNVTIVGHSMGSFVAQHVAAMSPDRVTKLILVGSATTISNAGVKQLQKQVNALSDPVSSAFAREFQLSTIFQKIPEEFIARAVNESLKLPASVWREVMAAMLSKDADAQLDKIKARTLILWGDKETVFPDRGDQEKLANQIANASLKVYEQTGHALHWERPEEFAKDLTAFIEKSPKVASR